MMTPYRLTIALLALVLVAGCRPHEGGENYVCADSGEPCSTSAECDDAECVPESEADLFLILKPLVLSDNNSLAFQAFPNDVVPLKVILLRSAGQNIDGSAGLTPVGGEVIGWSISGPVADASLSNDASLTGDDGIAVVAVDVGETAGATFMVNASATGTGTVTFSIQIKVDARELRLLTSSAVDTATGRTERLRVQLIRPTGGGAGTPVDGETLHVTFTGGPRNDAGIVPGPAAEADIVTDLAGIATVRFKTGTLAATYEVVFCGALSCPGVGQQVVTLYVSERGSTGVCLYFTDCDPGYICVEGACELAATYCNVHSDCPVGYFCNDQRTCELGQPPVDPCVETGDCDAGFICDTTNNICVECIVVGDCDPGYICSVNQLCIPENACDLCPEGWCNLATSVCPQDVWTCDPQVGACIPPIDPGPIIDVSGTWQTNYMFDISDTLPGIFTDFLGPVIDFLDMIFRSQLEIDIPILGDVLEAIIDAVIAEYVPPWVPMVVTALGDFIHLFEHMLVSGEMDLFQPGAPADPGLPVSGEETWDSARFFIASMCPGGILEFNEEQIPTCGQVDVLFDPVIDVSYSDNDPEVQVAVDPFAGQVEGEWLRLYSRNVDIGMKQLVNVLLDLIVTAASNGQWYDFEEFLADIIPCQDLQYAIDDLACDITDGDICSIPGIEAICEAAAVAAAASLTDALGEIAVTLSLDFDQGCYIHTDGDVDQPVATQLGSRDDPPSESTIVGETTLGIMSGDLDNSWWFGGR